MWLELLTYFLVGLSSFATGFLIAWIAGKSSYIRRYVLQSEARAAQRKIQKLLGENVVTFSSTIQKISPAFCKIFDQAHDAEKYELDQVCGIAYGKALEFLVKDLAKRDHPSKGDAIEKATLSVCVREYIQDPLLQNSAELAAWLRNDQAHYVRRYKHKDVDDLKRLILIIVTLIESFEARRTFGAHADAMRASMKPTRIPDRNKG